MQSKEQFEWDLGIIKGIKHLLGKDEGPAPEANDQDKNIEKPKQEAPAIEAAPVPAPISAQAPVEAAPVEAAPAPVV